MPAIFISYRRDDSMGHTGRLHADLARHFGEEAVFMDVSGIEPGMDFEATILDTVGSCSVLLAIIGKSWLIVSDPNNGRRRLDNPKDYVRLEIATALQRGIKVIPVLVHGAHIPKSDDLPDEIKALSGRHAHEITDTRWDFDVGTLTKLLEKLTGIGHSAAQSTATAQVAQASQHQHSVPTNYSGTPQPADGWKLRTERMQRMRALLAAVDPTLRLSNEAAQVLVYLVRSHSPADSVSFDMIQDAVNLHATALDDALHELKDGLLIKATAEGGNRFSLVTPRVRAWEHIGKDVLGFDVQDDMLTIAHALAQQQSAMAGAALKQATGFSEERINIAVLLLEHHRRVVLANWLGSAPYLFGEAEANYRLRGWLKGQPQM